MGTSEAEDDIDASIIMNRVELKRGDFVDEPVAPTGDDPQTFTAEFVAELVHEFELRLDERQHHGIEEDNNQAQTLYVVEPT